MGFIFAPAMFPLLALAFGSVWSGVEFVLVISYVSTLLFGAPLFFLFKWRRWFEWWQITGAAAVCALPFAAVLIDFSNFQTRHLTNSLQLIATGAIAGLVFWAIALAGNSALTAQSTRTRA
jgi:hypothetical protein